MKKVLSISLAMLVLLVSMCNGVIYLCYKMNQHAITEKWCVNKDKPQMHCHGKCYLKQQLAKMNEQDSKELPVNFQPTQKIDFFTPVTHSLETGEIKVVSAPLGINRSINTSAHPQPVFQPPDGLAPSRLV